MSRLRSSPLFLIFGFVLLFVVVWALVDDARSRALGWENLPAGEISLKSPDGHTVSLSDFKGKVVLVDFWATWCGPCRQSIPVIRDLYKKYSAQGFQVIGPALERDDGRSIPAAVQEMGIEYPVGLPNRSQAETYVSEGMGIPYMVLVDKKGVRRWHVEGYEPGSETEMERRIEALLAE